MSASPAVTEPSPPRRRVLGVVKEAREGFALRNFTLLLILGVVWIYFETRTDGVFLSQRNLVLLALQTSIVALAAISAVMLIVTRNFDLSVGSAVALVGVIVAVLTVRHGWNTYIACAVAIAAGLSMGAWQGFWVTKIGVSSFIVTLAGMLYFRGFSMIITDGETVAPVPTDLTDLTGFLGAGWSYVIIIAVATAFCAFELWSVLRARKLGLVERVSPQILRFVIPAVIGTSAAIWVASFQGVPYLVLLVAFAAIAADVLMRRTSYGAKLYAIGGNPEAARLAGIDINRVIFINFVIAGLAYGITGIALTARVSGAVAGSAGLFLELDAIAAAIIGGTALAGGRGTIVGALLGALLMGSLNNGMSLMNVPTFYQDTARGVVLLLAVAIDQYSRRRDTS